MSKTQVKSAGQSASIPDVAYGRLLRYVLREHPDLDEERVRAALLELERRRYVEVDHDFGPESVVLRLRD